MINVERTVELFGYNPDSLSTYSSKKIVANCVECGVEKIIRKADSDHKYCKACKNKNGRNYFSKADFSGKNNGRYKNGYTLKKHYCIEPNCGKEVSCRSKYCKKHVMYGTRSPVWKGGITALHNRIRAIECSIKWRKGVFDRDEHVCSKCFKSDVKLDVHHIKPFHTILTEFLSFYSQFSPIDDKDILVRLSESWSEFWNIDNAILLCEECHNVVHNKRS